VKLNLLKTKTVNPNPRHPGKLSRTCMSIG
jgi:hypothetical protein